MTKERHDALEKVGFTWKVNSPAKGPKPVAKPRKPRPPKVEWPEMFKRLKDFKKKYGHCKLLLCQSCVF